jgi:hypothetical protein
MTNSLPNNPLRVAVVSIGRSGTSLFGRILDQVLGVDFGDEADHIPKNHNNPDGYFENAAFMAFNDRVLQAADGWVLSPPPMDYPTRFAPDTRAAFIAEAAALLAKYSANKPTFGWKDPRLSFTWPIWREACPNAVPIIAFRKPLSVLSSIGAQLDRPVEPLAPLWFQYYQRVFAYTEGQRRYVVSYDDLLADPVTVTLNVAAHLGMTIDPARVRAQLSEIVKPQQSRHTSATIASESPSILDFKTISLYEYLRDSVKNGGQPDAARLRELLV